MDQLSNIPRDITILVVDDFQTMRRIIRTAFEQLGFTRIEEAENGQAAFSILKSRKIDFVVSDWNMPEMMGIDLLKAVRGDEKLKDLPFLMVTAESQKENVVEAVKAGVTNYIVKPFNRDTLEKKLAAVFKPAAPQA
ncbi:MAG: response regulator [Bdellovibrionota bacterium]